MYHCICLHAETFSKFRRVLEEGEEESFKDLGLGRGVDATNPTPWLNKKALQIREVISGDIIGTEEGNLYQGFVNEVESTQHFQTNLSASVPVNQLVNLGIDSELSRSYSATQKSVGRKIITRTISFLASFDKIVEKKPNGAKNTFEDRLLEWIEQQREEEKKIKSFKDKEKKRKKDGPRFLESGQEVKEIKYTVKVLLFSEPEREVRNMSTKKTRMRRAFKKHKTKRSLMISINCAINLSLHFLSHTMCTHWSLELLTIE